MTRTVQTRIFNASIIGKYLSIDVDVCALSGVPDMVPISEMSAFRIQPTAHACSDIIVLCTYQWIFWLFSTTILCRYIMWHFRCEKIRPSVKTCFNHFVIPTSYTCTKKSQSPEFFVKYFFLCHIGLKLKTKTKIKQNFYDNINQCDKNVKK